MSSEPPDELLVSVLRKRGVAVDSPADITRIVVASDALAAALEQELTDRRDEFIDRIPDGSWKALFTVLPPESRRAVIKVLGLSGDGQRRPTATQQSHVVKVLRVGLSAKKDRALTAAHDLTEPVRTALITAAGEDAPWDGTAVETTEVRAAAVALCARHHQVFLPVVLSWMREHDQDAFACLLGREAAHSALRTFWNHVTRAGDDVAADDHDRSRTLADTARGAVDDAMRACHEALTALEGGRAPHESSIEALANVRDVLATAAASLSEQLATSVEPTLHAIDKAVDQIATGSESAQEIELLLRADVTTSAASALTAAVSLAEGLLDRWPPATEDDRANADLLRGIVQLATIASSDDSDDPDIDAHYEQLRSRAPKEIVPLLNAAVRAKLRFAAEPVSAEPVRAESVSDSANEEITAVGPAEVMPESGTAIPQGPAADVVAEQDDPGPVNPDEKDLLTEELARPAVEPPAVVVEAAAKEEHRHDAGIAPEVVAKAVAWLEHGQFALVHHLLAPHLPELAEAAAFAAVGTAVSGPACPHAAELDAFVAAADLDLLVNGDAARLMTTVAAIVAGVTTGNSALGDVLVALSDRIDSSIRPFVRAVGESLRRGVLAGRGVDALGEAGADDVEIVAAATAVRDRLDAHRKIRLPRASAVLARLRNADPTTEINFLGAALHAAAVDNRADVHAVQIVLGKLGKTSALERLIEEDDTAHRPPSSARIMGSVRREMLTTLRDDIAAASQWARAVERHDRSAVTRTDTQVEELRSTLLSAHGSVTALLASYAADPDALVAASARAAGSSLSDLIDRVTTGAFRVPATPVECPVLEFPLLAIPGYAWDDQVVAPAIARGLTEDLLEIPDTGVDLASVALAKAEADDYRTAEYVARQLTDPRRAGLLERLADGRAKRVELLRKQLRDMRHQLMRAGVGGLASDGPYPGTSVAFDAVTEELLAGLLTDALHELDGTDADLRTVTQVREAVQERITEIRDAESHRLEERLGGLSTVRTETDIARIRQHLIQGRLDLAEDDLDHVSGNDPLFQPYRDEQLESFFPDGVAALPDGIDRALLVAVREGLSQPAMSEVRIPERLRAEVADGLASWTRLRQAFSEGWKPALVADELLPALRLVGLDIRPNAIDHLDGTRKFTPYARGRRFVEVRNASLTGSALIPEFGSAAHGRYRLLIVWNQPTAAELDEWRESDNSFLPLIVCYLGSLSIQERLTLARLWSDPSRRATVVLDDALLAWVAVRRGGFDELMRLSLPFTAVQPYLTEKRPDIPEEMFYGRDREKRRLLQPGKAPSIVYGGRGMGKSALMYRIANEADDSDLVVVWFEVDKVPGIHEQPDLLWMDLEHRLADKGIARRQTTAKSNARDAVTRAIQRWTENNPGKRLLLLLDEAEGFVEGDAPNFAHVRRLLDLTTKLNSRCQVVFAGLHSVQHYSVGNSPLSPTGHLQIGPLASQHAYDLLVRPMAALGYRLDDSDAQRVLLHCNYQPYLIQLVAEKLLARQFAMRSTGRQTAPPWRISAASVAEILSDADSRRDLRAALGLTLDLDKRTRVIANLLAMHAYRNSKGARMTDAQLIEECRSSWPQGFESTHADAFRQLLDELVGLGVLAEADDSEPGRAIRNETVLRALGSKNEVEQSLRQLPYSALPLRQAREYQRPVRENVVRRSPLDGAQHAQLLKKGNIARVLVGSEATGIDHVVATLWETRPMVVDMEVVEMRTLGEYKTKLETGATADRRYLVVGDLTTNTNVEACQQALDLALGDQSGVGIPLDRAASRTVALVAGVPNIKWLLRLAATGWYDEHMMPLRRFDRYTLPLRWQGDHVLGAYASEEFADRAFELTGGWPLLVEDLAADARAKSAQFLGAALDRLEKAQADAVWCANFLRRSGADFAGWPEMRPLAGALAEYEGPCAPADLAMLTGRTPEEIEVFKRVAGWLALISVNTVGELVLGPLISHCVKMVSQ